LTRSLMEDLRRWWGDLTSSRTNGAAGAASAVSSRPVAAGVNSSAISSSATTMPSPEAAPAHRVLPLGPFEATDAVLGTGGYARVVLGRNRDTGERVAIKLLDTRQPDPSSGRAASPEAAIVREVAALRRAGAHPNVCQLHGYYRLGEDGACHAMVLELCRGGELFRLVERYGALDEKKIRPIFVGVLEGLQHLHAQGIAHRDLKLENIMLAQAPGNSEGAAVPKICDLGLAHTYARGPEGKGWAERELTQFCGSRSYCAPEVMARLGYNGYRADAWSLGVCLFGLVAGFFPVDEASSRDWRFERISRLQSAAPHESTTRTIFGFYGRTCPLSPALVDLLDGLLQVAPAKRLSLEAVAVHPWAQGAAEMPASPVPQPVLAPAGVAFDGNKAMLVDDAHNIEVDVSDYLNRSAGATGEDAHEYRSAGSSAFVAGAAPPMLARQRAEVSIAAPF